MISLPTVTLIAIDCITPDLAQKALLKSSEGIEFSSIKLLTDKRFTDTEVPTIYIPEIGSGEEYSRYILKNLNSHIETDHALIVQNDGFVMNPKAWTNEFLNYDYIGAAWGLHPLHHWPPFNDVTNENRVGNGGFSLRSKKLLKEVTKKFNELNLSEKQQMWYHPEDCFIVRSGLFRDFMFAPYDLANKFSTENKTYCDEFGFHGKETMKMNNISL
jgi:hypothetical protein